MSTEVRHALIVATAQYSDPKLRQLRAPAADAERLAEVLRDPERGNFEVEVLVDEQCARLTRRIASFFRDRRPNDLLLLHFSCHGVKDERGDLYLAASDTEIDLLSATGVSAEWLNDQITHTRSRRTVVLLDCCFSGSFPFGMHARAGDAVHAPAQFEGRGRVIITASSDMEYSYEGDQLKGEGQPSVFTEAVVEGLETGQADLDHDQLVSVDDLYGYVYDRVKERTPAQTPNLKSEISGPLYLARSSYRPQVEPARLDPELLARTEDRYAGIRFGAVHELSKLLTSRDPSIALAAREALSQLTNDDSRAVTASARSALAQVEPAQTDAARGEGDAADAELAEVERAERERAEVERAQRERAEVERAQRERAEVERAERERAERERAEVEQAERARAEAEQAERESDGAQRAGGDEFDGGAREQGGDASRRRRIVLVAAACVIAALAGVLIIALAGGGNESTPPAATRWGPGVALDLSNRVWVSDPGTKRVVNKGAGNQRRPDWHISEGEPRGVASDAQGHLYVAVDNGTKSRVIRLPKEDDPINADQHFLATTLPAGSVEGVAIGPVGRVLADPWAGPGRIWLSDPKRHQLIRVATTGDARQPDIECVNLGDASPHGLATSPVEGRVWIADQAHHSVIWVARNGGVGDFTIKQLEVGANPTGIAVGTNDAWVTHAGENTITRIRYAESSSSKPGPPDLTVSRVDRVRVGPEPVAGVAAQDTSAKVVSGDDGTVSTVTESSPGFGADSTPALTPLDGAPLGGCATG